MEQIYPKGEFGFPAPYTREWFKAVESGGPLNPSFCVVGFTRIWQVYRPGSSVPSGTLKLAGTALAVYRQYSWTDRQDCRHRWGRRFRMVSAGQWVQYYRQAICAGCWDY